MGGLLHPVQNQRNQFVVKFHVDCEVVAHAGNLNKARVTGVRAIDNFCDGGAVGAAHDGVAGAVNNQDWSLDLLPELAEIQRLQLLIEGGWPTVLTVRLVVPQCFPFRVLAKDFAGRLALDQVQIVKLGEGFHGVIYFGGRFFFGGQADALVFQHVLVPGASPGTCGDKPGDMVVARDERADASAVAEADDENLLGVNEVVLLHGVEGGLIALEFALIIGLIAGRSLAFANAGLIHADGGIAGLVDQAAHQSAKAVGFALGIFDAVATEPANEENDRYFAAGVFRAGDEGAQLVATAVADPVVGNFGVGKVLAGGILLGLGDFRN